jgi:hypothetical protein
MDTYTIILRVNSKLFKIILHTQQQQIDLFDYEPGFTKGGKFSFCLYADGLIFVLCVHRKC